MTNLPVVPDHSEHHSGGHERGKDRYEWRREQSQEWTREDSNGSAYYRERFIESRYRCHEDRESSKERLDREHGKERLDREHGKERLDREHGIERRGYVEGSDQALRGPGSRASARGLDIAVMASPQAREFDSYLNDNPFSGDGQLYRTFDSPDVDHRSYDTNHNKREAKEMEISFNVDGDRKTSTLDCFPSIQDEMHNAVCTLPPLDEEHVEKICREDDWKPGHEAVQTARQYIGGGAEDRGSSPCKSESFGMDGSQDTRSIIIVKSSPNLENPQEKTPSSEEETNPVPIEEASKRAESVESMTSSSIESFINTQGEHPSCSPTSPVNSQPVIEKTDAEESEAGEVESDVEPYALMAHMLRTHPAKSIVSNKAVKSESSAKQPKAHATTTHYRCHKKPRFLRLPSQSSRVAHSSLTPDPSQASWPAPCPQVDPEPTDGESLTSTVDENALSVQDCLVEEQENSVSVEDGLQENLIACLPTGIVKPDDKLPVLSDDDSLSVEKIDVLPNSPSDESMKDKIQENLIACLPTGIAKPDDKLPVFSDDDSLSVEKIDVLPNSPSDESMKDRIQENLIACLPPGNVKPDDKLPVFSHDDPLSVEQIDLLPNSPSDELDIVFDFEQVVVVSVSKDDDESDGEDSETLTDSDNEKSPPTNKSNLSPHPHCKSSNSKDIENYCDSAEIDPKVPVGKMLSDDDEVLMGSVEDDDSDLDQYDYLLTMGPDSPQSVQAGKPNENEPNLVSTSRLDNLASDPLQHKPTLQDSSASETRAYRSDPLHELIAQSSLASVEVKPMDNGDNEREKASRCLEIAESMIGQLDQSGSVESDYESCSSQAGGLDPMRTSWLRVTCDRHNVLAQNGVSSTTSVPHSSEQGERVGEFSKSESEGAVSEERMTPCQSPILSTHPAALTADECKSTCDGREDTLQKPVDENAYLASGSHEEARPLQPLTIPEHNEKSGEDDMYWSDVLHSPYSPTDNFSPIYALGNSKPCIVDFSEGHSDTDIEDEHEVLEASQQSSVYEHRKVYDDSMTLGDSMDFDEDDSDLDELPTAMREARGSPSRRTQQQGKSSDEVSPLTSSGQVLTNSSVGQSMNRPGSFEALTKSLNHLLNEQEKEITNEREMSVIRTQVEENLQKGGISKVIVEVDDDDLLPEHRKTLGKMEVMQNEITNIHPGEPVFDLTQFGAVFTYPATLSLEACGFVASSSRIDQALISGSALACPEMIVLLYKAISCPNALMDWLFLVMSVHTSRMMLEGLANTTHRIMHLNESCQWTPSLTLIARVLVNYGMDVGSLMEASQSPAYSAKQLRLVGLSKDERDWMPEVNADPQVLHENLPLILEVIIAALQLRPEKYSYTDLISLAVIVFKFSLHLQLRQCPIIANGIYNCLASLLNAFTEQMWPEAVWELCQRVPSLSSHHHNQAYLVQLVAGTERAMFLQRRLALATLCCMVDCPLPSSSDDLIHLKLDSVLDVVGSIGVKKECNFYQLFSTIMVIDQCVGNTRLKTADRKNLELLMKFLRKLTSDAPDSFHNLDKTMVKELITSVCSRLSFMVHSMGRQQGTLPWVVVSASQSQQ